MNHSKCIIVDTYFHAVLWFHCNAHDIHHFVSVRMRRKWTACIYIFTTPSLWINYRFHQMLLGVNFFHRTSLMFNSQEIKMNHYVFSLQCSWLYLSFSISVKDVSFEELHELNTTLSTSSRAQRRWWVKPSEVGELHQRGLENGNAKT